MRYKVHRPSEQLTMNVVNQSDRTSPIKAIVLHDTEGHDLPGTLDLKGIGAIFDNSAMQRSAHVCVDGEGNTARYVPDERKAWHCVSYNSQTLGIEQIGFATFITSIWNRNKRRQLKKVAKWIAWWSQAHSIPIRKGQVADGVVTVSGVVTHGMLGAAGGGHTDPGRGYPFATVLRMARWYKKHGWR